MAESLAGQRILLTTDAVGGIWTYSVDLLRELSGAGMECVLAIMGPSPAKALLDQVQSIPRLRMLDTGLPLDWLATTAADLMSASRQLADLARSQRCNVVQLHAPALAAAGGFTQPVVAVHHSCLATWWLAVKPHQNLPEDFRWRISATARGISKCDVVVTPTTALAHAVADVYGLNRPPVTIRNGRHLPPAGAGTDVAARERFVITSGRLWDEGKNIATLDKAAARAGVPFLAAGPVAGPSSAAATFPALRLTGQMNEPDMRQLLASAPIYASAARYEPFGLGVLEAAQAGCALVLSDIPSFRELWSGACLFVAPDDDAGYAAAISRLLGEPGLLRRLSGRAAHRARHYTVPAMAREMMQLYAGLITLDRVGRGAAA